MIKIIKLSIFLTVIITLLSNCSSVQNAFDPKNKNTSDEFLVEKKKPLSMPPSFEELPIPSNQKITQENKKNNIKSLITEKNNNNEKSVNVDTDKDFEQSILDKIKNN